MYFEHRDELCAQYIEARNHFLNSPDQCATRDDVSSNDTVLMKALVERIIVWDDHIEVAFKCGARIEQEYVK